MLHTFTQTYTDTIIKKGNSIKTTTKTEIRFRKTDTLAVKRTKVLRVPIADGFREIIYQPNIIFFRTELKKTLRQLEKYTKL